MDALPNQRIKGGAERQGEFMSVGEVGEDQRDDGVDRPGIETPMEVADLDRLGGGCRRTPRPIWRRQKVHDGLSDAVKHHADADTRRKQHREPRNIAVSRLRMVWPQLDITIAR